MSCLHWLVPHCNVRVESSLDILSVKSGICQSTSDMCYPAVPTESSGLNDTVTLWWWHLILPNDSGTAETYLQLKWHMICHHQLLRLCHHLPRICNAAGCQPWWQDIKTLPAGLVILLWPVSSTTPFCPHNGCSVGIFVSGIISE